MASGLRFTLPQVTEDSLLFTLSCLRTVLLPGGGRVYSSVLAHIILEAVPANLTATQLAPVAEAAAELFVAACTPDGSRTAVKIAQVRCYTMEPSIVDTCVRVDGTDRSF